LVAVRLYTDASAVITSRLPLLIFGIVGFVMFVLTGLVDVIRFDVLSNSSTVTYLDPKLDMR
jgi:hypothetical protein